MSTFTPISALLGGALIGASATAVWALHGRIAGVSGIMDRALGAPAREPWRVAFLVGLVAVGLLVAVLSPGSVGHAAVSSSAVVLAGVLVGFGTRLGNGCTSGHGVCGLARLSVRSLVATTTFIAAGVVSTYVTLHGIGAVR